MGRGRSLPPGLGLVTLSLLVQLFDLGQDVSYLPLSHLQIEQTRVRVSEGKELQPYVRREAIGVWTPAATTGHVGLVRKVRED